MILSKKKIAICITILCSLLIIITCFCSFTLPDYQEEESFTINSISEFDIDNLIAIIEFQQLTGNFNNLVPIALYFNSALNELRILLINEYDYTLNVDGTNFTLVSNTSYYYKYSFSLKSKGFSMGNNSSLHGVSTGTFNGYNLIAYRPTINDDLIINPNYNPTSNIGSDEIKDIVDYWYELYSIIINYESDISNAESQGFSEGYSEGESNGYNEGYHDGFDTGYNYGYQFGHQDGIATGRAEGYIQGEAAGYGSGYQDGYDDGYQKGYESAEGETEIIYRDAFSLDIDKIISGIGSVPKSIIDTSFDINILGLNIAGILGAFIVVVVVVFVIKRLKT